MLYNTKILTICNALLITLASERTTSQAKYLSSKFLKFQHIILKNISPTSRMIFSSQCPRVIPRKTCFVHDIIHQIMLSNQYCQ